MRAPKDIRTFAKALRQSMSPPEVRLWRRLKTLRTQGVRIRRQYPIGRYVLDFYCAEAKLGLEIDGFGHVMGGAPERDAARDAWLASRGIEVVRIPASDVMRNPDKVADWIARMLMERPPQSASPTAPP